MDEIKYLEALAEVLIEPTFLEVCMWECYFDRYKEEGALTEKTEEAAIAD